MPVGGGRGTGVPATADPRLGAAPTAIAPPASKNRTRNAVADRPCLTAGSLATLQATSRSAPAAPPAASSPRDRPFPGIHPERPLPDPSALSYDAPPD